MYTDKFGQRISGPRGDDHIGGCLSNSFVSPRGDDHIGGCLSNSFVVCLRSLLWNLK